MHRYELDVIVLLYPKFYNEVNTLDVPHILECRPQPQTPTNWAILAAPRRVRERCYCGGPITLKTLTLTDCNRR